MTQVYRRHRRFIAAIMAAALITCALAFVLRNDKVTIDQVNLIDRPAKIYPDYSRTMIPPNMAPLNFSIQENGSHYCVQISSAQGETIELFSRSPEITIPEGPWRTLIEDSRGEALHFIVFVKTEEGPWNRFSPIVNHIANEAIDRYLVYRKIRPVYGAWGQMGIYQRDLHGFDESVVLNNDYFKGGCVNCHSFCDNKPDKMLIGIRSPEYGSSALLTEGGEAHNIGTKFGYTSWHPSGRLATYSMNKVTMFFHTAHADVRDVIDLDSMLSYYLVDSQTVKTAPEISQKDRLETYPTWSPGGRYLYFCSAPLTWTDRHVIPSHYSEIKYDLVRIGYDVDQDQWGKLETVLSSQETGLSILLPRISPDGRWLLFCMSDYGCFPAYQRSSDLYMVDLKKAQETGQYEARRLQINSNQSESWHSWSTNSRWIAFSSKRGSGVFTRSYVSYVDKDGKVHKPLALPQEDPDHYNSCLWTYSVPELINQPVQITKEKLGRVIRGPEKILGGMPVTSATPRVVAPASQDKPWLTERE